MQTRTNKTDVHMDTRKAKGNIIKPADFTPDTIQGILPKEFADISRKRRKEIDNLKIYGDYRSKIKDIAKAEVLEASCFVCEDCIIYDLPF